MTVELTYLAYTIALFFVVVVVQAQAGINTNGPMAMMNSRDNLKAPSVFQARMKRLTDNFRENLWLFTPLILIAAVSDVSNQWTLLGAQLFILGSPRACRLVRVRMAVHPRRVLAGWRHRLRHDLPRSVRNPRLMIIRPAHSAKRLAVLLIGIAAGFAFMPAQASAQRSADALAAWVPKDLVESVTCLDAHLPEAAMSQFAGGPDARLRHLGMGLWLRNNWGLWRDGELAQFFAAEGVRHPDNMSAIILGSYDLYLAGCRLNWNDITSVRAASADACAQGDSTQN